MFKTWIARAAAVVAIAALPTLAMAQTASDKERLRGAISASLASVLGGDSARAVVDKIATVKPDGAISKNFNVADMTKQWFGPRTVPNPAPDCRTTQTASGESDEGLCLLEVGRREADKDSSPAYSVLAYSKNIGIGDLLFARRPAGTVAPAPMSKLSDSEAYDKALAFLRAAGVPMSEVPQPPRGFLPVRSLAIGMPDDKGGSTRMTIQKVVSLPRAFAVSGGFPWLKDPRSGQVLAHVVAPGKATIAFNDAGVQFASIEGWSDAQMGRFESKDSKSVSELADEITDDLWGEGVQKVGSLSILISLRKALPNPDDPNPPQCPACGLLLPAVQVMVAPVGPELLKQGTLAPPGLVREYNLVRATEAAPNR